MNNYLKCGFILYSALTISFALTGCTKTKVEIVNPTSVQSMPTSKPVVKVFLENSGSMDGYMCDGSELKDGIYNYLTCIKDHASKMELYYINSEIKKQNTSLSGYIRNLNPTAFQMAGGNKAFTDIPDLFTRVLATVNDNTIAVFISDCILDIPNHAAPNYLYITKTDMHSTFSDKIAKQKNMAVCIYQLESSFKGRYYFPKGGSQMYDGKLPYYMFVVGTNAQLANLRKNVSDSQITHGVKNYCAFAPSFDAPVSLLKGSKPVESLELNTQRDGRYQFKVQANLNMSLQHDDILTSISNYTLSSPKEIVIENISTISSEDSEYSHIIEFSILNKAFGNVVTLNKIQVPSWVTKANDRSGNSVAPGKTFGVEYIIGGIADAYKDKTASSFKLNIKKQ